LCERVQIDKLYFSGLASLHSVLGCGSAEWVYSLLDCHTSRKQIQVSAISCCIIFPVTGSFWSPTAPTQTYSLILCWWTCMYGMGIAGCSSLLQ